MNKIIGLLGGLLFTTSVQASELSTIEIINRYRTILLDNLEGIKVKHRVMSWNVSYATSRGGEIISPQIKPVTPETRSYLDSLEVNRTSSTYYDCDMRGLFVEGNSHSDIVYEVSEIVACRRKN